MLDIKPWLETTGMSVAEVCFTSPPPLPYIIFTSDEGVDGADNKNCISNRSVSIEFYSEIIDYGSEKKIEGLLNEKSIAFTKSPRTWIESERLFQTVYDFDLVEKF